MLVAVMGMNKFRRMSHGSRKTKTFKPVVIRQRKPLVNRSLPHNILRQTKGGLFTIFASRKLLVRKYFALYIFPASEFALVRIHQSCLASRA